VLTYTWPKRRLSVPTARVSKVPRQGPETRATRCASTTFKPGSRLQRVITATAVLHSAAANSPFTLGLMCTMVASGVRQAKGLRHGNGRVLHPDDRTGAALAQAELTTLSLGPRSRPARPLACHTRWMLETMPPWPFSALTANSSRPFNLLINHISLIYHQAKREGPALMPALLY
jgi:hypothetical protein